MPVNSVRGAATNDPGAPTGARHSTRTAMSTATSVIAVAACLVALTGCGGTTASPTPSGATSLATTAPTTTAPATSAPATTAAATAVPEIAFTVVASYPHDSSAWTQGLAYAGPDRIYEGTGDYENSSLREVDLATGEVLRSVPLPSPDMYGEGITVLGELIVQLTWRDGVGLVYRADDFATLGEFRYPAAGANEPREGWGITTDGTNLFVSDGTASVYVADAERTLDSGELTVTRVIDVQHQGRSADRLNELEYVDGQIYANVWQTDQIVRFDASSGEVNGQMDVAGLLTVEEQSQADTPNGISYDPVTGHLLVTGKNWPRLFALRLE